MDFGASWGPPGHVLGRLGPSWERLGPSWGRLGGVLGASWAVLGRLGVVLKSSWSALEVSWAILETTLLPENNFFEACHLGGHFSIGFSWVLRPKIKPGNLKNH